ncbi:unnamed protein product [Camellia sinensis]
MLFRFSFLVVASVSAFAIAQINLNCSRRRNSTTANPKNDGSSSHQEQIEEIYKFEDSNVESKQEEEATSNTSKSKHIFKQNDSENSDIMSIESQIYAEELNNVIEIEKLKNEIKEMEERRAILEVKLLEFYGLRDQKFNIARMQSHLEAKIAEIDILNVTIDTLQAERKKLIEEIKQHQLAENELEIARKMILELEAKLCVDASRMKGKLKMIKEQVYGIQMEETLVSDSKVENRLRLLKDLEMEVVEMKRRSREIQLEKRELAIKLSASQAGVTALSNMTQIKIIAEIEAEKSNLRLANEELLKQVDRLQRNRFGMVEELMYQRWLNACLRFETQNSQNPQPKTPKTDFLRKNSSSEFHKKNEQPSSDSTLDSISSSESNENTSSTIDSSSSSQKCVRKKFSLIHKITRLGARKDETGSIQSPGLIRRFSTSSVHLNMAMPKNEQHNAFITPSRRENVQVPEASLNFRCTRRVSFNDSIQTLASSTFEAMPKSVNNEKTSAERLENSTTFRLEGEKSEFSSAAIFSCIEGESASNLSKKDDRNVHNDEGNNTISKSGTAMEELGRPNVPPIHGDQNFMHLVAAFLFLLLVLLVFFKVY